MASVDDYDYMETMRTLLLPYPQLADRYDRGWQEAMCRQAGLLALAQTNAGNRLDDGTLDPNTFTFVVCQMVLRVMRYTPFQGETNGSYTYDLKDDQSNPPGYDASPNLYLSKNERTLLDGTVPGRGKVGTIGIGLHRIYGM